MVEGRKSGENEFFDGFTAMEGDPAGDTVVALRDRAKLVLGELLDSLMP